MAALVHQLKPSSTSASDSTWLVPPASARRRCRAPSEADQVLDAWRAAALHCHRTTAWRRLELQPRVLLLAAAVVLLAAAWPSVLTVHRPLLPSEMRPAPWHGQRHGP